MTAKTSDFVYDLPEGMIAYTPAARREDARLLVLDRKAGTTEHTRFSDVVRFLRPGDVLVVNETRVIRARLEGEKTGTGGHTDLLLLREIEPGKWEALVSPSRRIHTGTEIVLAGGHTCRVTDRLAGGKRVVEFDTQDVMQLLDEIGEVPLPPYIKRRPDSADRERYQTVYARRNGSVAAPTAGLHFTDELLSAIEALGVDVARLTLHVGLGSFRPVKDEDPSQHILEPEYFEIDEACCSKVNAARPRGGRIVAVGTTSVRGLETAADRSGGSGGSGARGSSGSAPNLVPARGWTEKFILPPYDFRMVDALVTNFHLPCSTLLMLVAAFAGRETILAAYREAVSRGYRFYSYGDAMMIL
jgi:S-adenosylmethionine:tRNA ribosyltransferase-isomerase